MIAYDIPAPHALLFQSTTISLHARTSSIHRKAILAQSTCQRKIEEGHSTEIVWYSASRKPSDTPPDRNYLAFAPKGIASTTPYSQGFRFLYQHSNSRRIESSGAKNKQFTVVLILFVVILYRLLL